MEIWCRFWHGFSLFIVAYKNMVAHKQACNSAGWLGQTGQTLPAQMCVFDSPLDAFVSSLFFLGSFSSGCLWEALFSPSLHACPADFGSLFQPYPLCRSGLCRWELNVVAQESQVAVMDSFLYQWKCGSVAVLLLRREGHAGSVLFLAMLVIIRQNHPIIRCYISI